MSFAVRLEPLDGPPRPMEYRWDPDTDILSARLAPSAAESAGVSGLVELEGSDGSWLVFDVRDGRLGGIEVAVWPDVRANPVLAPPEAHEGASAIVPLAPGGSGQGTLEVEAPVRAEADTAERVIYFRIGQTRAARTLQLARDLLLEVDSHSRIAGLWLLNVPPFPTP